MTQSEGTSFKALTFIDQSKGTTRQNTSLIHRHLAKRRLTRDRPTSNDEHAFQVPKTQIFSLEKSRKEEESKETIDQSIRGTSKRKIKRSVKPGLEGDFASWLELYGKRMMDKSLPSGRVDPFDSLAVPSTDRRHLELLDYLTNIIWPTFSQHGGGNFHNPYASYWLERSYYNRAIRHAFAMAASLHMSTNMRHTTTPKQKQDMYVEQLMHQYKAIQSMREQLEKRDYPIEDLMMTIICLWSNPIRLYDLDVAESNPFEPPLSAGVIDIYCNWEYSAVHQEALLRLVSEVGGVQNIKAYGIPWIISA